MDEDVAVIYHYFNKSPSRDPEQNAHAPILHAISSLRRYNGRVRIYVIDRTPGMTDWGEWSQTLKFDVAPIPFSVVEMLSLQEFGFSRYYCEKVFDIYWFVQRISQRYIIYSDADIFWFRDVLPLSFERFGLNPYGDIDPTVICNSGFYSFDKLDVHQNLFMFLWQYNLYQAATNPDFARKLLIEVGQPCISDESTLVYTARNSPPYLYSNPRIVRNISNAAHFAGGGGSERGIHCIGTFEWDKRSFCLSHGLCRGLISAPLLL